MKMKKNVLLGMLFATMFAGNATAQTQLTNNGFENWEEISFKKSALKTLKGDEPLSWSSFLDATGGLKSLGAEVQLFKETTNPHSGSACAKIIAKSVAGGVALAQGNLTTGCVNMGSMSPEDASGNYNYINRERTDQSMRFSGRPNKFRIWLRGKCATNANVAIHLVTDGYYQDPAGSKNTSKLVAFSKITPKVTDVNTWVKYEGKFDYTEGVTDDPYYVLVNISTSDVPGAGDSSDVLYIDDLEMIYDTASLNAIETVPAADAAIYNLAGQRVSGNARGIVIKNGKKFIK